MNDRPPSPPGSRRRDRRRLRSADRGDDGPGRTSSVPDPRRGLRPSDRSRMTLRRSVEEPGQVEAFEVTAIHAQGRRLRPIVEREHRDQDHERPGDGRARRPRGRGRGRAEAGDDRAGRRAARPGRGGRRGRPGRHRGRPGQGRRGAGRHQAGRGRSLALAVRSTPGSSSSSASGPRPGASSTRPATSSESAEAAREEIEAQVKTAEAAVAQSRAGLDKARSDLAAAKSGIAVARSEARRVETLLGFAKIVAPFDGVVTRRNVDTGHLTIPGAQGEPLFVVARSDLVTVSVAVPELFVAAVDPGDLALDPPPGVTRPDDRGEGHPDRPTPSTRSPGRSASRSTCPTPTASSTRASTPTPRSSSTSTATP